MAGAEHLATAGKGWWILGKAVFLIVGTFVFSYIFWWTKGLVEKSCSPKKRKK